MMGNSHLDDELELIIQQLQQENAELKSQLEALQMREDYEDRVRERDALAAKVEQLSELLIETVKHWDSDDDPTELHSFVAELSAALNGTPTQSLKHIKAQVEEETIERCVTALRKHYHSGGNHSDPINALKYQERKYAKQAGSTVEEGLGNDHN